MLKFQQSPAEKAIQEEDPIIQPNEASDALTVNLALGTLTLILSVGFLYVLNRFIFLNYEPNVKELVNQALSWSVKPSWEFAPEPVERLQFLLTLVTLPLFIYGSYLLTKPLKKILEQKPGLSFWINVAGINIFLVWLLVIFIQDSSSAFLKSNLFGRLGLTTGIIFYSAVTFFFLRSAKIREGKRLKIILRFVFIEIAALIFLNILLYNWFNVSELQPGHLEVNVVLYPLTQVLAGKSLLVDLNSQYGLYAWFLAPLFRVIGLSAQKFAVVMGIMNAACFLFIYLGLKKVIKQSLLCFIVFLALVYWQYWFIKIPFESMPRHYFQYWPIRIFFPAMAFYLIVLYFTGSQRSKKILLPLLSLTASFAVMWNFDSGLVVYGAVFISLIYSAFSGDQVFRKILKYISYMLISLIAALGIFILSTYLNSGAFPDLLQMFYYQKIFYISGFNMMAMEPIHFWHLPALIYIIACFYCIFHFKKQKSPHSPVIAFLLPLGCGLFAYFQGRSYGPNVTIVMYPAIILLGIFSGLIFSSIEEHRLKFHPAVFLFFISFTVLADGAFSMLENIPQIQGFSWKNALPEKLDGEYWLKKRREFITNNFRQNDTVIILSKNFESYYYAEGIYYNPVNIPSSTEMFCVSDFDSILTAIKKRKYAVFFDSSMVVDGAGEIGKELKEHAYVSKRHPDRDLIIYRPKRQMRKD